MTAADRQGRSSAVVVCTRLVGKGPLLILFLLLALTSPVQDPKTCAGGSAVLCRDLKTAVDCGALKHCQQMVWSKPTAVSASVCAPQSPSLLGPCLLWSSTPCGPSSGLLPSPDEGLVGCDAGTQTYPAFIVHPRTLRLYLLTVPHPSTRRTTDCVPRPCCSDAIYSHCNCTREGR